MSDQKGIAAFISSVVEYKPVEELPGDYRDEKGILHCGTCHQPKEGMMTEDIQVMVKHTCQCEIDRRNKERVAAARDDIREKCFGRQSQLYRNTFDRDDGYLPDVRARCMRFVEDFPTRRKERLGMYVYGEFGTGKSFFCDCMLNGVIDRWNTVENICSDYPRRVTAKRIEVNDYINAKNKPEFLDILCRYSVIYIDDLGEEGDSPIAKRCRMDLINRLYNDHKLVIISSNLDPVKQVNADDAETRRTFNKILEMCPDTLAVLSSPQNGTARMREIMAKRAALSQSAGE